MAIPIWCSQLTTIQSKTNYMQQPTFFVSNIDANESVIDANECVTSFLKHAQVNRILDTGTLDLFIGVTQHQNVFLSQYQNVTCFSNKPKNTPIVQFVMLNLVNLQSFVRIHCKLIKICDPSTCKYQGIALSLGLHFIVKIDKFGVPYFYAFPTDSNEISHIIYSIWHDKLNSLIYIFVWMKTLEKHDISKQVHIAMHVGVQII